MHVCSDFGLRKDVFHCNKRESQAGSVNKNIRREENEGLDRVDDRSDYLKKNSQKRLRSNKCSSSDSNKFNFSLNCQVKSVLRFFLKSTKKV